MKIKLYLCSAGETPTSQHPLGLGYLKTNCNADIEIVNKRSELNKTSLF